MRKNQKIGTRPLVKSVCIVFCISSLSCIIMLIKKRLNLVHFLKEKFEEKSTSTIAISGDLSDFASRPGNEKSMGII